MCECVGQRLYNNCLSSGDCATAHHMLSSVILGSCRETHGSSKKRITLALPFDVQITLTGLNINIPPKTHCPSPLVRLYLRDGGRKGEDTTDCRAKIVTHVLQLQPRWTLSPPPSFFLSTLLVSLQFSAVLYPTS